MLKRRLSAIMFGSEATLGGTPKAQDAVSTQSQDVGDTQEIQFSSASETDIEAQDPHADPRAAYLTPKRLTLTFKNLTVRVPPTGEALGETLWSRVDPTQIVTFFRNRRAPAERVRRLDTPALRGSANILSKPQAILNDVSGQVKSGEMVCNFSLPTVLTRS